MKRINSLYMRLSEDHKRRIDDVILKIREIPYDESSFTRLELFYYDVLAIARVYGNSVNENKMLAGLKHVEYNEYKHAQERFKKSSQKVVAIQKFRNALKKELSSWINAELVTD
jgi:hypothetical protein